MSDLTSGNLSIEQKSLFALLKHALYEEQDIVFRELISNACDAIEKRYGLLPSENGAPFAGEVHVHLNTKDGLLVIRDNGIGMTRDEVDRYINQIAFSGAEEFVRTHGGAGEDTIIGHFGVGFYSAFMAADHVSIETKSVLPKTDPVRWDCYADMSFTMQAGQRSAPGTEITLHLGEDVPYRVDSKFAAESIRKYFQFNKTPVFFSVDDGEAVLINDPDPVWRKPDADAEAARVFYRSYFDDPSDPLFWMPFESADIGVRGILFFRNVRNGTAELDGTIRVFSRGVYIGENIRALIPKFVNLQNGILECDNLPLAVTRSNLVKDKQGDGTAALIRECLTQEVAIRLHDLFSNARAEYEAFWPNLNAFVKYAVLQDRTLASVMMKKVIFRNIFGSYQTLSEYLDEAEPGAETVYYASDAVEQAHYIELFKKVGMNALLFDHVIDQPFLRKYETVRPSARFVRVDSDIGGLFEGTLKEGDTETARVLEGKIQAALGERLDTLSLRITRLKHDGISMLIINDEKARRMADMLEMYGMVCPEEASKARLQAAGTLLVNLNNPLIRYLLCGENAQRQDRVLRQLYDLAKLNQQALQQEHMEEFILRSEALLIDLIDGFTDDPCD